MTRRQLERLAQALRTIGDGFLLAASTLLEMKDDPGVGAGRSDHVHDQAFIDQRSTLVPREVYLRLARENAFPSKKIGKRVVAQWGLVQAALAAESAPTPPTQGHDYGHDPLRRALGLQSKGGS